LASRPKQARCQAEAFQEPPELFLSKPTGPHRLRRGENALPPGTVIRRTGASAELPDRLSENSVESGSDVGGTEDSDDTGTVPSRPVVTVSPRGGALRPPVPAFRS